MDNMKSAPTWSDAVLAADNEDDAKIEGEVSEKMGDQQDARDMIRMGKKQELRREFQFFSIWDYAVILG